ncbi:hypothetical protein JCM8547_002298 [Rhodosporidiobolus lusitaniae]
MVREKRKSTGTVRYTEDDPPADSGSEFEEDAYKTSGVGTSAGKQARRDADEDDDDEGWSGHDDADEPAKKKRKVAPKGKGKAKATTTATSKAKGKGRQGRLKAFSDLPMDLVVEIARFLDPLTLLYMSRANKMMANVFASKTSIPIWIAVRHANDIPDLEEANDLNELQYASLLFERNCHRCGRSRASIVDYNLAVRWCKNCERATLMAETKFRGQDVDPAAVKCSRWSETNVSRSNWRSTKHYLAYFQVKAMSDQLQVLRTAVTSARGKTARDEANSALNAFIEQRVAVVAAAVEDGKKLRIWVSTDARGRKSVANANRTARKEAIVERLVALGHDKQDTSVFWGVNNLVDQPTRLTDLIWNKISAEVIKVVEDNKRSRLRHEASTRKQTRRDALRPYFADLFAHQDEATQQAFPSFYSFLFLPSVESFWKDEDSSVSAETWTPNAVMEDVHKAIRVLKVGYARKAADVLGQAGVKIDPDLLKKLADVPPPPAPDADEQDDRNGDMRYYYSYGSTSLGYQHRLNLLDSAPLASEEELDKVLSHFLLRFSCQVYSCSDSSSWPAIQQHVFSHSSAGHGVDGTVVTAAAALLPPIFVAKMKEVLDMTSYAGDDGKEVHEKLEKLGAVWDCKGCKEARAAKPYWHYVRMNATASEGLTWSEMKKHTLSEHVDAYYHTATPVKIVLSAAGRSALNKQREEDGLEPVEFEVVDVKKVEEEKPADLYKKKQNAVPMKDDLEDVEPRVASGSA